MGKIIIKYVIEFLIYLINSIEDNKNYQNDQYYYLKNKLS